MFLHSRDVNGCQTAFFCVFPLSPRILCVVREIPTRLAGGMNCFEPPRAPGATACLSAAVGMAFNKKKDVLSIDLCAVHLLSFSFVCAWGFVFQFM